jgi:tetraacyldisaccharide 4'-kinase
VSEIGDEPRQYKQKFPKLIVSVGEDRVLAVGNLLKKFPSLQTILLDDAFQHRSIKPGLSILLRDYIEIFSANLILPAGTLREGASAMKRADLIIITKTPSVFSSEDRKKAENRLGTIIKSKKVLFSYIRYGDPLPALKIGEGNSSQKSNSFAGFSVLLLTGIANPLPLIEYLKVKTRELIPMEFPDHHEFTESDIRKISTVFDAIHHTDKVIITTEKDLMRLSRKDLQTALQKLPIFYIPIEIAFHNGDREAFKNEILQYINSFPIEVSI